jgi:hypothetical protein
MHKSRLHFRSSVQAFSSLPLRSCMAGAVLLFFVTSLCLAHNNDLVCEKGDGSFHAEFQTGVAVSVRAARVGELATRTCEASLSWGKNVLTVATNAFQIDLDVFGVDVGLGVPVTAFQVKKSSADCCTEYAIYSLEKPPRLLRTITGSDSVSAADTDLDGRIEIWTHDTAAVADFEHLSPAEFDSAPSIVLRLVQGKLTDASSEFQPYFDRGIARLRE